MLNRARQQAGLRLILSLILLVSLYLLTQATEDSERFGRLYLWLLAFNGAVLVVLVGLIMGNLRRLWQSLRQREPGAQLTRRILLRFALLAVIPGLVVYGFSMRFLRNGIDSWFDVPVESALQDAIELRKRDRLDRVQAATSLLDDPRPSMLPVILGDMRSRIQASELTLFGSNGQILASSSRAAKGIVPPQPADYMRRQARQGRAYVGLDQIADGRRQIRVVVPAPNPGRPGDKRVLQALFPVSPRLNRLADNIQEIRAEYGEVTSFQAELKESFSLTLSLVLLASLLFALWSAFYLARRLVAPVTSLAEGTRAVAAGEYGTQLPTASASNDELGFLVRSFNDMTRRVAQARDQVRREQVIAESQRRYLETVLSRLSSGVLTLDQDGCLRTYNQAANQILSLDFSGETGSGLTEMASRYPELAPFAEYAGERAANRDDDWREQLTLDLTEGRRVLICSGTQLPGGRVSGGHVVVFDDVTTLVQAQRDAAWGEVARRLAHEIRNPLTPIQLAAERLRHKLGSRLEGHEAEVLDTAIRTIVDQVDTLKTMVNAFSEYARPPQLELEALDINSLVREVRELYRSDDAAPSVDLAPELPLVRADRGRLRQLLNNLIRNAIEAAADGSASHVELATGSAASDDARYAEAVALAVRDTGPGFASEVINELFEPYVTTKSRGTGLGLPIVKKIVEEHNGAISARNTATGAEIIVSLPVASGSTGALPAPGERGGG